MSGGYTTNAHSFDASIASWWWIDMSLPRNRVLLRDGREDILRSQTS